MQRTAEYNRHGYVVALHCIGRVWCTVVPRLGREQGRGDELGVLDGAGVVDVDLQTQRTHATHEDTRANAGGRRTSLKIFLTFSSPIPVLFVALRNSWVCGVGGQAALAFFDPVHACPTIASPISLLPYIDANHAAVVLVHLCKRARWYSRSQTLALATST